MSGKCRFPFHSGPISPHPGQNTRSNVCNKEVYLEAADPQDWGRFLVKHNFKQGLFRNVQLYHLVISCYKYTYCYQVALRKMYSVTTETNSLAT